MDAIRKRLFNQNATPGAHLRRISWIYPKIFKSDQSEPVNQIPANLMSKFISLVSDPLMDPFNDLRGGSPNLGLAIFSPLEKVAKLRGLLCPYTPTL
ncbi:MAG: hypothetical protein STSR0001_06420 [Methanothrix sp.]